MERPLLRQVPDGTTRSGTIASMAALSPETLPLSHELSPFVTSEG